MSEKPAALSKAEWGIMNICYQLGRCTARQVYEASIDTRERDYQTVKTLLDRIAAKGYLKVEKVGPICLFSPSLTKRRALAAAIDDFVSNVLDNSLAPLFQHLHGSGKLSEDELTELKKLLIEKDKQDV